MSRPAARAVLFDLDDTLFDHRRSARAALQAVHGAHAPDLDFAEFERHHAAYLEEMHVEVLAGRIGLDDARRERFRRVFLALGVALDAAAVDAVAAAYRTGYTTSRRALDGAAPLLAALRPHARIAIVTNNLLDEQQDKLEYCGLAPLVDVLVASEDVGVAKPDPRIFAIALDRAGVAAAAAVMVGDAWVNDIVGATRAGVRAIWFNPHRAPKPAEPADVPEIHALGPAAAIVPLLLGGA
ncbi:MAG TPA: HAD-IA family hydrolase [Vicinamibacterales bacterium]|nr:HAD-IA family hydrolase [Vicinamibacterales bacterium]